MDPAVSLDGPGALVTQTRPLRGNAVALYRRKPTDPISAVQWTGYNLSEVDDFVGAGIFQVLYSDQVVARLYCSSSAAWLQLGIGDWVIAEMDGSGFYKCDKHIFESTYEAV